MKWYYWIALALAADIAVSFANPTQVSPLLKWYWPQVFENIRAKAAGEIPQIMN